MTAKREGFWRSTEEPDLPMPITRTEPWDGARGFVTGLYDLQKKSEQILYRGFSVCRVCGKPNGNGEFEHKGWVWPSGYLHYVEQHYVKPSPEFSAFVLERQVNED